MIVGSTSSRGTSRRAAAIAAKWAELAAASEARVRAELEITCGTSLLALSAPFRGSLFRKIRRVPEIDPFLERFLEALRACLGSLPGSLGALLGGPVF